MTRPLDLRDLRAFVAVAEEGSIRRAAERLHVSQPPLSRRMQALEKLVGAPLLTRTTAGVETTAEGKRLAAGATRLLARADALLESVRRPGRTPLRIGFSLGLPLEWERRVGASMQRALQDRGVQAHSDYTPALVKSLRGGSLDFALLGLPGDTAGLEHAILASQPMVVALPRAHPASRHAQVPLRDLAGTPLFWFPRALNARFHDSCERAFRQIGFKPRYITVDPGQPRTLERIGQGEGFTLLNGWSTRVRVPGVSYRPIAEGALLSIQVAAAWKAGRDDAATQRIVRVARRALREL